MIRSTRSLHLISLAFGFNFPGASRERASILQGLTVASVGAMLRGLREGERASIRGGAAINRATRDGGTAPVGGGSGARDPLLLRGTPSQKFPQKTHFPSLSQFDNLCYIDRMSQKHHVTVSLTTSLKLNDADIESIKAYAEARTTMASNADIYDPSTYTWTPMDGRHFRCDWPYRIRPIAVLRPWKPEEAIGKIVKHKGSKSMFCINEANAAGALLGGGVHTYGDILAHYECLDGSLCGVMGSAP